MVGPIALVVEFGEPDLPATKQNRAKNKDILRQRQTSDEMKKAGLRPAVFCALFSALSPYVLEARGVGYLNELVERQLGW